MAWMKCFCVKFSISLKAFEKISIWEEMLLILIIDNLSIVKCHNFFPLDIRIIYFVVLRCASLITNYVWLCLLTIFLVECLLFLIDCRISFYILYTILSCYVIVSYWLCAISIFCLLYFFAMFVVSYWL